MAGILHGVGGVEGRCGKACVGFEGALRLRSEDPAALVDGKHAVVATNRLHLDGYHSFAAGASQEVLGDRVAVCFAQPLCIDLSPAPYARLQRKNHPGGSDGPHR